MSTASYEDRPCASQRLASAAEAAATASSKLHMVKAGSAQAEQGRTLFTRCVRGLREGTADIMRFTGEVTSCNLFATFGHSRALVSGSRPRSQR